MRTVVAFLLARVAVAAAGGGTIVGTVAMDDDGRPPSEPVVVYIDKAPVQGDIALPRATLAQQHKQFAPQQVVVTRGTEIDFPNRDIMFHNVFSLTRGAEFDLGLYRAGASKTVRFDRPGVVDVYCNIHPEMVAKIKVMDNPHFATTDASGHFRLPGVPPGTFALASWSLHTQSIGTEVVVSSGKDATVQLRLRRADPTGAHTRKDGSAYGRYK